MPEENLFLYWELWSEICRPKRQNWSLFPSVHSSFPPFWKKPLVSAGHLDSQQMLRSTALLPLGFHMTVQASGMGQRECTKPSSYRALLGWALSFLPSDWNVSLHHQEMVNTWGDGATSPTLKGPGFLSAPGPWSCLESPDYSLWTVTCNRNRLLPCLNT